MKLDRDRGILIPEDFYVFFVDESGHEKLADPLYPIFALAGCGCLAKDLDTAIRAPWLDVRTCINGLPTKPLHASTLRRPKTSDLAALNTFFREGAFSRIGVSCSDKTIFDKESEILHVFARSFINRVVEVAKWTIFRGIVVIFEDSQRLRRLLPIAFSGCSIMEHGRELPLEFFVMAKTVADPALEVADFVAHAVGGHAPRYGKYGQSSGKDFISVFHQTDKSMVSYMHISEVR
jgi:hypothetical protein